MYAFSDILPIWYHLMSNYLSCQRLHCIYATVGCMCWLRLHPVIACEQMRVRTYLQQGIYLNGNLHWYVYNYAC